MTIGLSPQALTGQLVIGALREHDAAVQARELARRAQHVSDVIRSLSGTLDETTLRDTMRRLRLARRSTWAMVEFVEADGSVHRLPAVHPDPEKRDLAISLERSWRPAPAIGRPGLVLTHASGSALHDALHDVESLATLYAIGFGSLLVLPLMIDRHFVGAITFVSDERQGPIAGDELDLAREIVAFCEMALSNARRFAEAGILQQAADEANRAKSAFLSTMSHELRTPLNAIGGYVEILDLGINGAITDEQHTSLVRIKANQLHLLGLISDILDYARLEAGHVTYQSVPVSLTELRADVVTMLISVAEAKGVTLVATPSADAVAWADPHRVRQIIVNLVTNAIKYGGEGRETVAVSLEHEPGHAVLRVADNGPGIPLDRQEQIFQPFVQLPAGLWNRRGGVGLGLAISRELAEGMGGSLTVLSSPGSGSVFTLMLPDAPASVASG